MKYVSSCRACTPSEAKSHSVQPQATSKLSLANVLIGLVVLCLPIGLVGWGVGALLRSPIAEGGAGNTSEGNVDAWVAALSAVKRDLKAPRSADFPAYSRKFVTDLGNGQYRVRAYVDADNSFGATKRTEFACTVRSESGDWTIESLVLAE